MGNVALLRSQIEASLAGRIPSALTPCPKREQESVSCGIPEIDNLNAFSTRDISGNMRAEKHRQNQSGARTLGLQ